MGSASSKTFNVGDVFVSVQDDPAAPDPRFAVPVPTFVVISQIGQDGALAVKELEKGMVADGSYALGPPKSADMIAVRFAITELKDGLYVADLGMWFEHYDPKSPLKQAQLAPLIELYRQKTQVVAQSGGSHKRRKHSHSRHRKSRKNSMCRRHHY